MRITNALKSDIRFQFNHGFYFIYILVTVCYIVILQKIPDSAIKDYLIPLIIYTDPAVLGFFFIGGIVMLEKQQGITDCLAVTPLDPKEYLISKTLSLSVVALFASLAIAVLSGSRINMALLVIAILLSSAFFTLYGFLAAGGCRTVNQYFLRAVPLMLLAIFPCFTVIGFPYSWLFRALPSVSGMVLMLAAGLNITFIEVLLSMAVMCVWIGLMFLTALRIYDTKILTGGGKE